MRQLDSVNPDADVWDETVALLAGELVALRTRLAAVEAAVGRPGPVGAPAPPTLPVLARRIATLERQAGIVPGLDLLAGPPAAATSRPARALPAPPTRGQVWRERGQAALAALVLLAVFGWLLRPTVPRTHPAPPVATATSAPTAATTVPVAGAANVAQPARDTRCAGPASEVCVGNDGRQATPAASEQACATSAGDGCAITDSPLPAVAGTTWTVALVAVSLCAGDGPEAACPHATPFAPTTLIIQPGDTIVWQVTSGRHTVTFPAVGTPAPPLYLPATDAAGVLNPLAAEPQGGAVYNGTALVGSGLLDGQAPVYRLTFPQPGHYVYVNLAYPGLVGEVIAVTAIAPPPVAWCVTAC
ncbi:MAG: cupredoxin domain-containing protein [Thermomicrobiales bacterium]